MKTFFARRQCSFTTFFKRRFCIASKLKSESPVKLFNVLRHPAERKKFVMVAMSGGVDSSVSAHLLKQAGHKVEAIYMQNWSEQEEKGYCSGEKDWHDASVICSRMGIPLHRVSFIREYWTDVFEEFLEHYENGMTPNPDVVCNREIKFKALLNHVMSNFQPDALATGHYAMVGYDNETQTHTLGTALDEVKDQTLFLCLVQSQQLEKIMFPDDVRKIAKETGMHVADKKTSVGLCFVGQRKFQQFIGEYLPKKQGQFFHLESGTYLKGQAHHGSHLFTIGQRAKVPGMPSPLYVTNRDAATNTVHVCEGYLHPALFHDYIHIVQPSWVAITQPPQLSVCMVVIHLTIQKTGDMKFRYRLRHRQPLKECTLRVESGDKLRVEFDVPQRAPAPGQYIAFYSEDGSLCYGGAMIQSRGPSYWDQQKPLPESFAD